MKKLTAGIFATLLAVVSADSAYAAIASSGYVDDKVGEVSQTVTTLSGTVSGHTTSIGQIEGKMATYGDIVTHNAGEFATAAQGSKADTAVQPADITNVERTTNKTQTVNAQSTEAQYPSAKAVWTAVSSVDANASVEALEGRVGKLETASATHATKTELTDGLAEKLDTATAATTYATKTELAGKQNTIAGAQLEALNSGITADKVEAYDGYAAQISGKLDTATADGKYAAKSTEGVASTASTNAQTALTNIGTLSQLTTEAKDNTVEAINEVATEAAAAASAASTADGKAVAAQGDVDALEAVVNHETTGLAAAHTAIDALESDKLDKTGTAARATADASGNVITTTYATKAEIADMATDENLALKQDKTDNSLATTNKTVVGAINEVKTTADSASTAAAAAQEDATQALADAATAQEAAEAAQSAAETAQATADKKQDKLTGTIGGSMQPVYLNNGTITAGTALGTLATKSTVTNAEVADGALAQSKIDGLATSLAAKLTTPPTSENGETGLYVLTYDGTDFQWEDIARTAAE